MELRDMVASFSIKSDGLEIRSTWQVVSIDVWSAVDQVPKAKLVLFEEQNFEISNLKTFIPGAKIEIAAGYDEGTKPTIFKGVVVRQGIEINEKEGSKLIVDIVDPAIAMTLQRKNAVFQNITDSDLIAILITGNGLTKDVTSTGTVHEKVVQYYASDWDLMITRAQMNGLVVLVEDGKITVNAPDTSQTPVLRVEYGESILDLRAEMNAATQYASSAIQSFTWDVGTQKLVEAAAGPVPFRETGNISSAKLAQVFGIEKFVQQTGAPIEPDAAQVWSSAQLLRSKLSKIRGHVRFQGASLARPGRTIELAGLGERFNGNAFISGVHHSLAKGQWLTTAEFGLTSQWFAEARETAAPGASGQLPAIKGLQTGIVRQVLDPSGEFRVLVSLPILQDDAKGVWARLGTFYASNGGGALFYPEIGDEVVVGFMNEDPRYPVIVGSLYSKTREPPLSPDAKNNKKALVTRSKLEISFDEENGIVEIKTPGGHSVRLDDTAKVVSIKDSNGNAIALSKDGITLDSALSIGIAAKGNITIETKGNLKLAGATTEGFQPPQR